MNPAKNKNAEQFLTHIHSKNKELICKERNCCNPRAAQTMSSYCVTHRMRRRQWFTSERVGWPAGALRKYYGVAEGFISDNCDQKPIRKAITLVTELVNGNFSQFLPAQYDHVLKNELSKRHYLRDNLIEALERMLGFYLFFKDHPTSFPDTDHGIKPYLAYSFFGSSKDLPGTRSRLALMEKLFLFYAFFEKSCARIFEVRDTDSNYLKHSFNPTMRFIL